LLHEGGAQVIEQPGIFRKQGLCPAVATGCLRGVPERKIHLTKLAPHRSVVGPLLQDLAIKSRRLDQIAEAMEPFSFGENFGVKRH
jgi:hypothetical protein